MPDEHITFEQGAISPLGWPYCCLCFRPMNAEDCWQDKQGFRWDVCVACHELEIAADLGASQPLP
jgi:hypothetical protein